MEGIVVDKMNINDNKSTPLVIEESALTYSLPVPVEATDSSIVINNDVIIDMENEAIPQNDDRIDLWFEFFVSSYVCIVYIFQLTTTVATLRYLVSESQECLLFSYKWQNLYKILIPGVIFNLLALLSVTYGILKYYFMLFEGIQECVNFAILAIGTGCYIGLFCTVIQISDFLTSGILVAEKCTESFCTYLITWTALQWLFYAPIFIGLLCLSNH